jgi:hypothetical protein
MFQVYTAPSVAFSRLKEKPVWLLPLIIALVANLAAVLVTTQYVDWTEQRQVALDKMRERGMTEEQIAKATEGMDKFYSTPLMRYGLPLVGSLFTFVIGVLFLTIVYNVALPLVGAKGSFLRTLAVVTNAGLIGVPAALVRIALVLVRKSADVSTSLLLAAPGLKGGFLAVILSRLDPFAIWQLILAGLGLAVMFEVKGSKTYWLVFSAWGLLTLVFALMGGRMGR